MAARAPHGSNQPRRSSSEDLYRSQWRAPWRRVESRLCRFVTAMMAFFPVAVDLGATTEKQRKGICRLFLPTLVNMKENSAGSNGMFGGSSITDKDN